MWQRAAHCSLPRRIRLSAHLSRLHDALHHALHAAQRAARLDDRLADAGVSAAAAARSGATQHRRRILRHLQVKGWLESATWGDTALPASNQCILA